MLIYEKDNKLNINFENKVDDPDLSLFKEDDKVKISANGSTSEPGQGGCSSSFVITFSGTTEGGDATCDKTWEEIVQAYSEEKEIVAKYRDIYNDGEEVEDIYNLTISTVGFVNTKTLKRFFANYTEFTLQGEMTVNILIRMDSSGFEIYFLYND